MKSYIDKLRNEATDLFNLKWNELTGNAGSDEKYNGYNYDDLENTFVHAYVSATLYLKYGEKVTLNLGYLKEIVTKNKEIANFGSIENAFLDTNRDLWNNQKGIEYAMLGTLNNLNYDEITQTIFNNIMTINSDFIIDYKNDNRRWDENSNYNNLWNKISNKFIQNTGLTLFIALTQSRIDEINKIYIEAAQTDPIYRDPLLIDLNGDGITTTDVNNGIYFDHDVNGFAEKSAWVSNDDGMLAFDVNNNGVIDNGSEIFGDAFLKTDGSFAQSGFDALTSLDSNNDNIIDANDSQFNNIKILKADGSLISLEEAGIVSISLNAQASNTVDENGNTQLNVSSFTKADGSTGSLADYTFVRDTLHTQATDIVEVPDDILALPDAQGYGNVSSLHQAMAKDSSGALKTLVQDFVNASSETDKLNLVKQIILKWTGVENIAADSRGEFYNAQQLAA